MKRHAFKYLIEFLVVVTGIIISLNIEKNKALEYKNDLKDQSLRRLIENIKQDISDSKINEAVYLKGIKSSERILNNSAELFRYHKDSLGYYLDIIGKAGTIFVDNQEEYLTLRNSGFLELIEEDSLVVAIQKKYSYHSFYKKAEQYLGQINEQVNEIVYKKTAFKVLGKSGGIGNYSTYIGTNNLTNYELNIIRRKQEISKFYIRFIQQSIDSDLSLIKLIEQEINKK